MPGSHDPKRPNPTAGSPDIWTTLGPRQKGDGAAPTSSGRRGGGFDPFPRLPAKFGRYRIERKLGAGAMGAVYLAHDTQLDRPVALKVPQFAAADGPKARGQFLREARAAATAQHPNLCPVFDTGEIGVTPYLTMAFIQGTPLTEVIADIRDALPERQVAALVRKLALALAELHRVEVVHRDLKPANIMLKPGGEPVIMDFGLARRGTGAEAEEGLIVGTPVYMAPEQADADLGAVGPRSDVYSLGVILYELLTKKVPFSGPDVYAVLSKLLKEEPKSPFAHRPSLDPRLEAICLKALAKRPEGRYQDMADFAAALTSYLMQTGPATSGETPVVARKPVPATPKDPPRRRPRQARGELSPGMWAAIVGASLTLAVVMVGGVYLALRPNFGEVRFELGDGPAGAQFRIDGAPITIDRGNSTVRLTPGPHTLDVTAPGHKPFRLEWNVRRGENPTVAVPWERSLPVAMAPQPEEAKDEAPAAEPPASVALRWKSHDSLLGGRIKAPDLPNSAVLLLDEFRDRASGFEDNPGRGLGYLPRGTYALHPPRGVDRVFTQMPLGRANPPGLEGPFAVEASGQLTSGGSGMWAIRLGDADSETVAVVLLSNTGGVNLGGLVTRKDGVKVEGPTAQGRPFIKSGPVAANKLLLVVIGRQLEVYVNRTAVLDPILLPRELARPRIGLSCVSPDKDGKTHVEFEYLVVYSAKGVTPATARGAVPKPD